MSDPIFFSKVRLRGGGVAEVKDAVARAAIKGGIVFKGITTTALADLMEISEVMIDEEMVPLANGDLVIYGTKEFLYTASDGVVHEMGDLNDLKIILPVTDVQMGDNNMLEMTITDGSVHRGSSANDAVIDIDEILSD